MSELRLIEMALLSFCKIEGVISACSLTCSDETNELDWESSLSPSINESPSGLSVIVPTFRPASVDAANR